MNCFEVLFPHPFERDDLSGVAWIEEVRKGTEAHSLVTSFGRQRKVRSTNTEKGCRVWANHVWKALTKQCCYFFEERYYI